MAISFYKKKLLIGIVWRKSVMIQETVMQDYAAAIPVTGMAPFENHPASIDFSHEELPNKRI
ncbi:hypothetical protein ABEY96_03335 [Priestia aryabhattai]|uniref:hypothetical protein n=1 Tax=Priestia aryabhattai TaxID=412384 RepID=UPI003D2E0421